MHGQSRKRSSESADAGWHRSDALIINAQLTQPSRFWLLRFSGAERCPEAPLRTGLPLQQTGLPAGPKRIPDIHFSRPETRRRIPARTRQNQPLAVSGRSRPPAKSRHTRVNCRRWLKRPFGRNGWLTTQCEPNLSRARLPRKQGKYREFRRFFPSAWAIPAGKGPAFQSVRAEISWLRNRE
jgi:hypothetical protein